ncbi:MAG: hypothetical protein ACK5PF_07430 [bacterium]|jgi:hypothetical protein
MAITTLDGAIAGMKPPAYYSKALSGTLVAARPFSPFYLAGSPGAAVAPTPGLAGAALTSYAGQIPIPPASANTHLARFTGVSSAQPGMLLLCDRLWHNSGIVVTTTTAQTINSVAWPARDRNGTTNGDDVLIGLEISTATGAGASVVSMSYTNSAGTAGRSGTMLIPYAATSAAGSFYPFALQAGDVGVRSIQSYTSTVSMTSGVVHLVAYRVLASLELPAAGIANGIDVLTSGMPRCYDTTVPFLLFIPSTTTTTQFTGQVAFTQG